VDNPYAPPSEGASTRPLDQSQIASALRFRTYWLRLVGGSLLLRMFATNLVVFALVVTVGRLFDRSVYTTLFFISQLVDLPCMAFTVVAMWKLTGKRSARPARITGRNLQPLARWFTIAWVVVGVAHRAVGVMLQSHVLHELHSGMHVGVLALTSSYAAELAPDHWLRVLAYAAAALTLATLPLQYATGMHWVFDMIVVAPTVIVTLLVARAANVD
jgi:hypothetical protein